MRWIVAISALLGYSSLFSGHVSAGLTMTTDLSASVKCGIISQRAVSPRIKMLFAICTKIFYEKNTGLSAKPFCLRTIIDS